MMSREPMTALLLIRPRCGEWFEPIACAWANARIAADSATLQWVVWANSLCTYIHIILKNYMYIVVHNLRCILDECICCAHMWIPWLAFHTTSRPYRPMVVQLFVFLCTSVWSVKHKYKHKLNCQLMSCNSNKFIHVARHCGLRLRLRSCHGLLSLASYRTRWHSRRENKNMCSHATQLSWTLGQISHQLNLNAMIHHINGLSWLDVICRGGWVGGHGGLGGWPGRHGTTYDINLISNSITHSIQKNTFHKLYKPP